MLKAAKGTRDILPEETRVWQRVERAAHEVFRLFAYQEIRTPLFEPTELFQKSTGAETDIVTKEMYSFEDRGGRSLTLRPEGTPGVVRAILEHGLVRPSSIERFYYLGPMFRYERPQKGRYRQFAQIGIEAFGSAHPELDAEVMQAALVLFDRLDIRDARLLINSVGHAGCRGRYRDALREALEPRREELCEDCRRRLDANPLRILDCKVTGCGVIRKTAPSILEYLCGECSQHFDQVRKILDGLELDYEVEPRLVRGLDYYTRTTFEVVSGGLGAQNAICGGGRYDDLVGSMGGPDTPAIGFAIGTDRLVLLTQEREAAQREGTAPGSAEGAPDLYMVHLGEAALQEAVIASRHLRDRGLSVRLDPETKDMKKQMARASTSGCRFALIIGERELYKGVYALKRLADGRQSEMKVRQWDAIRGEVVHEG